MAFETNYKIDITSYDTFRKATIGKGYDVDGAYGAQCYDGAALLWKLIGKFLSSGGTGAARGCWTNAKTANAGTDFDLITKQTDILRGDVIVFSRGTYGHIGFADEDWNNSGKILVFGQNQGGTDGKLPGAEFTSKYFASETVCGAFRLKRWAGTATASAKSTIPENADTYSWVKVTYGADVGYVADEFLDKDGYTTDALRLRATPSLGGSVITTIPKGAKVTRFDVNATADVAPPDANLYPRKVIMATKSGAYVANRKITPVGIIFHDTGTNGLKNTGNLARWVEPDDGSIGVDSVDGNSFNHASTGDVCPHAVIGKLKDGTVELVQVLPWDTACWCSGAGNADTAKKNGFASNNANFIGYIQVETACEDYNDTAVFEETWTRWVEFGAWICAKFSIPVNAKTVISHKEGNALGIASNHGDPESWLKVHDKTMDDLRKAIAEVLAKTAGSEILAPTTPTESTTKSGVWAEVTFSEAYSLRQYPDQESYKLGQTASGSKAIIIKGTETTDEKGNVYAQTLTPDNLATWTVYKTTAVSGKNWKEATTGGAYNLRSAASVDSASIEKIPGDTKVIILDGTQTTDKVGHTYIKTVYNGRWGWTTLVW